MGEILSDVLAAARGMVIISGRVTTGASGAVGTLNNGSGIRSVAHASGLYTFTLDNFVAQFFWARLDMLDANGPGEDMQFVWATATIGAAGTAAVAFESQVVSSGAAAANGPANSELALMVCCSRTSVPGGGLT